MHTDKAIAEFDAWWIRQPFHEQFEDLKDQMRNVWVASREELVIQLPAQYGIGGLASDAHDRAIAMCKDAIEAAGAKWRE